MRGAGAPLEGCALLHGDHGMVITAYFDESGTHGSSELALMAGYIARGGNGGNTRSERRSCSAVTESECSTAST